MTMAGAGLRDKLFADNSTFLVWTGSRPTLGEHHLVNDYILICNNVLGMGEFRTNSPWTRFNVWEMRLALRTASTKWTTTATEAKELESSA